MSSIAWAGAASAAPVPVLAAAEKTEAPRKGVVVLGIGASPQAFTWPVARAVYADATLRPQVDDPAARVLAGDPAAADAKAELKDLAALRAQVRADGDAASRVLLADIARRTRARAIALVVLDGDTVEVRVYDAAEDRLESTKHRAEAETAWSPLVGTLRARFATAPTSKPAPAVAPTPAPAPEPKKGDATKGGSFLSSPWFWGALGAAVAGGVAAYALTRDDGGGSPPVRIEWGAR